MPNKVTRISIFNQTLVEREREMQVGETHNPSRGGYFMVKHEGQTVCTSKFTVESGGIVGSFVSVNAVFDSAWDENSELKEAGRPMIIPEEEIGRGTKDFSVRKKFGPLEIDSWLTHNPSSKERR